MGNERLIAGGFQSNILRPSNQRFHLNVHIHEHTKHE